MAKYIKKKALKNAIDCCTWYHINKNGELVEGANPADHEPLYKYSDIKEIIKNLPTRKFETEPKRTALSKALKWTYGDEQNSSEKPNNCEPQTERIKTLDYCDICNHKGCDNCIANNLDDYCVPSGYEPITQTETQNSNLTFEKADERCKGCNHYKLTCDLFSEICRFEPKDEPQTDCSWK